MVKMVNVCLLFFLSDSKLNLILFGYLSLVFSSNFDYSFVLHDLVEYLVKFQHFWLSKTSVMPRMVAVYLLISLGNSNLDVELITDLPISFCPTCEYQSCLEFDILNHHKISESTDIHN
jgi:hypothetical protein